MVELLLIILLIILIHTFAPGFFPTVGMIIVIGVVLYFFGSVIKGLLQSIFSFISPVILMINEKSKRHINKIIVILVVCGIVYVIYKNYNTKPITDTILEVFGCIFYGLVIFGFLGQNNENTPDEKNLDK